MERDSLIFADIKRIIDADTQVNKFAKPGLCRIWSAVTYESIVKNNLPENITLEVRESQIIDSLTHSFLRLKIGSTNYIMDGTGVNLNPPYFGLEIDAPPYLQNSDSDGLINSDLK